MGPMPSTRLPTRMTSSPAGTGGAVSMSVSSWISSPAAFSPLQFSHTITLWLSCTYANACAKSCSARLRPSSGPAEEGSLRSSLVIASGVALDPTCLYPDATIVFFSAIAAVAEAVKGEGRNNAREKCQGTGTVTSVIGGQLVQSLSQNHGGSIASTGATGRSVRSARRSARSPSSGHTG